MQIVGIVRTNAEHVSRTVVVQAYDEGFTLLHCSETVADGVCRCLEHKESYRYR